MDHISLRIVSTTIIKIILIIFIYVLIDTNQIVS